MPENHRSLADPDHDWDDPHIDEDDDDWYDDNDERREGSATPVFDMARFRVNIVEDKCKTCIFRPGNLMHLADGRVKQMVDDCIKDQGHIVCHSTLDGMSGTDGRPAVPYGICNGFYTHPQGAAASTAITFARATRLVTWINPTTGQCTDHDTRNPL